MAGGFSGLSSSNATVLQGIKISSTAPTDGQVLKYVNGNLDWEPGTVSGQTPYDAVVAPSGGDYTTLSAAITAGKTRIRIKGAITETATIVISSSGITIDGDGRGLDIITFTNAAITGGLSISTGVNSVIIRGIKIIMGTGSNGFGAIDMPGTHTDINISDCYLTNNNGTTSYGINMGSANTDSHTRILIGHNRIEVSGHVINVQGGTFNFYVEHNWLATSGLSSFGIQISQPTTVGQQHNIVFNHILLSNASAGSGIRSFIQGVGGAGDGQAVYAYNEMTATAAPASSQGIYVWVPGTLIYMNNIHLDTSANFAAPCIGVFLAAGKITLTPTRVWNNNMYSYYAIEDGGAGSIADVRGNSQIGGGTFYPSTSSIQDTACAWHMQGNFSDNGAVPEMWLTSMRNETGASLADGDVVIVDNGLLDPSSALTTTTLSDPQVKGVCRIAMSAGASGYVQTYGLSYRTNVFADSSLNALNPGNLIHTYSVAKQSVYNPYAGFAISADTATTQGLRKAFLLGGVTYKPLAGNVRVSSQFDKVDATLANVTGLSVTLLAGRTYVFEATLFTTDNVTGGTKYAIAGTATATAIIYDILLLDEATKATTIASRQTAMAGSAGQAGTTSGICKIYGTITVNAAGTLTVQFAQNTATGTSSVLVGSTFVVQDIT